MTVSRLDPTATALVLVDLQRGVVALPVAPHPADAVVANAMRLARAFRAAGAPVILVRVSFSADGADALTTLVDERPPRSERPPGFDEIVEGLREPGDVVVTKRQWGAFYGTDLDLQMRRRGIDTVVLGGIATNLGVESTARPAREHGYHVVLAEDAMSALSANDHAFAFTRIFPRLGRVASTGEILAALDAGPPGCPTLARA
jgi:nicotinamidase-related amidase